MREMAHILDMSHPARLPVAAEWGESYVPDEMTEQRWRALSRCSSSAVLPFFGSPVACGLFGISDDYIEKYQSLDARFVKNKASTFFFEATGTSMEPLIFAGDVLVVDRSIERVHQRVAVVCLNGEMACKRVFKTRDGAVLKSDNPAYKDIPVTADMDFSVFGVVIALARDIP